MKLSKNDLNQSEFVLLTVIIFLHNLIFEC